MSQFLGETPVLTTSVIATADIAEDQLVGFDGAPAGNDGLVYGKARAAARVGEAVTLTVIGLIDLIAPAAIATGSLVASDVNGAPKQAVNAVGAFAHCVKGAAAPGERVTLLIR